MNSTLNELHITNEVWQLYADRLAKPHSSGSGGYYAIYH